MTNFPNFPNFRFVLDLATLQTGRVLVDLLSLVLF